MLWHNIKLTFRNLLKDLKNSCINILGLSVGMATVILIMLYVQNELSYDQFNTKHERIYRIYSCLNGSKMPETKRLTANNFTSKIPEIETIAQVYNCGEPIQYQDKRFTNITSLFVDSSFYRIFDLEVLLGSPKKTLAKAYEIIITDECSQKIFGTVNSIGKSFNIEGRACTVGAIVKKLPKTSHYQFDFLLSTLSYPPLNEFEGLEFTTYVLFKEKIDQKKGIQKAEDLYTQIIQKKFSYYGEKSYGEIEPMTDIHLHSPIYNKLGQQGDFKTLLILIALAFVVLLIALINFINIMTVQYEAKMGEIGLRKAIGANRSELIHQFLGNSFIYATLALFIAIILSEIFLSKFNLLIRRELSFDYSQNIGLFVGLVCLWALTGFLSGTYPAFYLSKFKVTEIIKGKSAAGHFSFTKVLVIFQFSVSIALLTILLCIRNQTKALESVDLGFHPENVMGIISLSDQIRKSYPAIKQELYKIPDIEMVSATDHFPGYGSSGQQYYLSSEEKTKTRSCAEYRVQADYFKALGITIKEGRAFREENQSDQNCVILNETAAKKLPTDDLIGRTIIYSGESCKIIGIAKDFYFRSLRQNISPLIFSYRTFGLRTFLIKYNTRNYKKLKKEIEAVLQKFDPSYKLNAVEVNKVNRHRYHQEKRMMKIISYTSVLSILIALVGLYSLSLFMIQKRTKEIGVRKVNGASITQISRLFLGMFSKWVLIAFLIAVPFAWFFINQWLTNFVIRISIGPLPFLLAGTATLTIALLTVFYHTWKAATQNPIESLRYE